jgi:4-hydroxybenzoate polyprenyltransferase
MATKQKPNKAVLVAIAVVHLTVARLTWRDIQSRPADQIRGNKTFWRVASGVNTLGSVGYWLLGRRRVT